MRMTDHSFEFIGVVKGYSGTPGQKLSQVMTVKISAPL
jgi:hypothetical protein